MPKSRGRRKSAKSRTSRRSPRSVHPGDRLLRDARRIVGLDDALSAEIWASSWLGQVWTQGGLGRDEPEHHLCSYVTDRACIKPTPHALAALSALARVAPASEAPMLTGGIDTLSQTQPLPLWSSAPTTTWTPQAAWRAVDLYASEKVLFIDFDGPQPHALMAHLIQAGGLLVESMTITAPGAANNWDDFRQPGEVPMPITSAPAGDVLGELAHALRVTDMTWPRTDEEDFLDHRALAWSRCREYLPDWPEDTELTQAQRDQLIADFLTHSGRDDQPSRYLAGLLLDYSENYIHAGPLHWSPTEVMVLLTDWLPRKTVLDPDDRAALPQVLRAWLDFALTRRGISPQWIAPVIAAVDTYLPDFQAAIDDETAWGPAKQLVNALTHRGVDLTDRAALDDAINQINAENHAHTPDRDI